MTNDENRLLLRRAFLLEPVAGGSGEPASEKPASTIVRIGEDDHPFIGSAVCTIGAFDGIHHGHRFLFSRVVEDARELGCPSVIVTFDPDPDELFLPSSKVRKILDNEDRISYLTRHGADYVAVVPFTRELASHTAEEFVEGVISSLFTPVRIHVGEDFRLGAGNHGSVSSLNGLGDTRGFTVYGHDLRCSGDEPVRATRIRNLLEGCEIEEATNLLGRWHYVRGQVQPGRHEGTGFGFPTANVRVSYPYVMPGEGVYGGFVAVDGIAWPAAINVGSPRSFTDKSDASFLEANLVGFSGDIYGREVRVTFAKFLRPQRRFDDLSELIATVNSNIDWVRENLGEQGVKFE